MTPLETSREDFVDFLQKTMRSHRMYGALVFDSHPDHSNHHPTRADDPHLEIIYSPTNLDADTYILEFLSTYPTKSERVVLVTSDNELSFKAKNFGAETLKVKDFVNLLRDKETRSKRKEPKPNLECRHQLERLLEIFEERYNP